MLLVLDERLSYQDGSSSMLLMYQEILQNKKSIFAVLVENTLRYDHEERLTASKIQGHEEFNLMQCVAHVVGRAVCLLVSPYSL